jgi:prepilin-type N-terminal cleavage/methylation domain-containing protein
LNLPPPDALERNCSKGFKKYHSQKHIQNKPLIHNLKAFTLAEVLIALVVIGVIAAITVPIALQSHKKTEVETKLKYAYSLINQAVNMAKTKYGGIENWDYTSTEEYVNNYLLPYIKADKNSSTINTSSGIVRATYYIELINGSSFKILSLPVNVLEAATSLYYTKITVDINGNKKPNEQGKDQFNFYILPVPKSFWNEGNGDFAWNTKQPGVYYDGYGATKDKLKNYYWRGCGTNNYAHKNSFCVALIAENGWKIPDDYPLHL